jgi:hypothetical protein
MALGFKLGFGIGKEFVEDSFAKLFAAAVNIAAYQVSVGGATFVYGSGD